ncbi:MAG: hypothetical protein V1866_02265 [archaeon]
MYCKYCGINLDNASNKTKERVNKLREQVLLGMLPDKPASDWKKRKRCTMCRTSTLEILVVYAFGDVDPEVIK